MKILKIKNISKSFDKLKVLHKLNFEVKKGEFFSIVGPNGCGKTTILNILAGILVPDSGKIILEKEDITGKISGKLGYMPQKDILLPWRNVFDNLKLVTEVQENAANTNSLIKEYMKKLNLLAFKKFYPYQLSGGFIKRTSLARTLIYSTIVGANVIMLDEPFSNLDAMTKYDLKMDLEKILREEGRTIIFVTHDISEAISISDRIVIFKKRPARIKKIFDLREMGKEGLEEKIMKNLKDEI